MSAETIELLRAELADVVASILILAPDTAERIVGAVMAVLERHGGEARNAAALGILDDWDDTKVAALRRALTGGER